MIAARARTDVGRISGRPTATNAARISVAAVRTGALAKSENRTGAGRSTLARVRRRCLACVAVRWFGVMVLCFALSACGSGSSGGGGVPSTTQLRAHLLDASDVGPSWQPGQAINPQDLAAFSQAPCEPATLEPSVADRLTAVTGTQFEPATPAYRHLIELVVTGDAPQLSDDLRTLFSTIESCSPHPGKATVSVHRLTIPSLGDQQAAYDVIQTLPRNTTTALSVRVGYVRMGSVAVLVGLSDFQASAQGVSQVSDSTFRSILRAATTKLRTATG